MSLTPLLFLSEAKLVELRHTAVSNLHRYTHGDFLDLEQNNGWRVESSVVKVDVTALAALDGTNQSAKADQENSVIVYSSLHGMTPALAREERIWTRLSHIECLLYSRERWLAGHDGEPLRKRISAHMFAPGRTGIRDDNAISRLWWNMHISTIADHLNPEAALRLLVQKADIRSAFIERPGVAARRPIATAALRAMGRHSWITSTEEAFREFMKVLNRDGGGVLFESMSEAEADHLFDLYVERAHIAVGE